MAEDYQVQENGHFGIKMEPLFLGKYWETLEIWRLVLSTHSEFKVCLLVSF